MAELYAVSGETLTDIADAIRSKTGSDEMMTVASMASAIEGIIGGGNVLTGTLTFDSVITDGTVTVDVGDPSAENFIIINGSNVFVGYGYRVFNAFLHLGNTNIFLNNNAAGTSITATNNVISAYGVSYASGIFAYNVQPNIGALPPITYRWYAW